MFLALLSPQKQTPLEPWLFHSKKKIIQHSIRHNKVGSDKLPQGYGKKNR